MNTTYPFDSSLHLTTMNNNEVYEKIRPLPQPMFAASEQNVEDRAHGDDTQSEALHEQEKRFKADASDPSSSSHFGLSIPPVSSSAGELSLEAPQPTTDTSNEALKTDDENGMTKSYFSPKRIAQTVTTSFEKTPTISSDLSLQAQVPDDECQYHIDLGNGWITKSCSSYQSTDQPLQPLPVSVLSAESIQPANSLQIPFTNTFYHESKRREPDVVLRPHEPVGKQQRWPKIALLSIGALLILSIILSVFFSF